MVWRDYLVVDKNHEEWLLRMHVAGIIPRSSKAIENLIIDLLKSSGLSKGYLINAVPTLVNQGRNKWD